MMQITPDMPLPRLHPDLRLVSGPANVDGSPTWRIYHPLAHQYYQIDWVEFEYISRFSLCENVADLENRISIETTIIPDSEILPQIIMFLNQQGLIFNSEGIKPYEDQQKSLLSELIHKYLFFSIPIVKPQKFLEATYPYVSFLFSRQINYIAIAVLLLGVFLVLERADEFFSTFYDMWSVEGAIIIGISFTVIKLLHELGHAYTAVKHGLNVPHMGIAFMVMYPVFYTETTSAWDLANRRERIEIGLAGIRVELILAACFLLLWNYSEPGLLQTISFSVVSISLISSLLVNLNPLMRFDGYFIFSDSLGIENLHSRAISFARWRLRQFLFGWRDEHPEDVDLSKQKFLILFGWTVLIYRFFLFAGIALLVYHLFPKPLGLILMIIELSWFIVRPVLSEFKIWANRRSEILSYNRGKISTALLIVTFLSLLLPIDTTVSAPAVYEAVDFRDVYAPYPSKVLKLNIPENVLIQEGDILAVLQSPELDKDIKIAKAELENAETIKRRQQTNIDLLRQDQINLNTLINDLRIKLKSYQDKQTQLQIRAPFQGYVKDIREDLRENLYISENDLLFRLIKPAQDTVTAYVDEYNLERLKNDGQGTFRPSYSVSEAIPVKIKDIARSNVSSLDHEELSSLYGGSVYSEFFQNERQGNKIIPRQSLYKITLQPQDMKFNMVTQGRVKISAGHTTPFNIFLQWLYQIILPESDVI